MAVTQQEQRLTKKSYEGSLFNLGITCTELTVSGSEWAPNERLEFLNHTQLGTLGLTQPQLKAKSTRDELQITRHNNQVLFNENLN